MTTTAEFWEAQNWHPGDRQRLYRAVADAAPADRVLYPGSYVDLAPSFVWPSVTYVDTDRRARRFFADGDGVRAIIAEQQTTTVIASHHRCTMQPDGTLLITRRREVSS